MNRVHLVTDKPLEDIERVAVGVYFNGSHVGVLHRASKQESLQVLHLCTHKECVNEDVGSGAMLWVQPLLELESANQVVARARQVYRASCGGAIPYGFSDFAGFFNAKGEIEGSEAGKGLTCATFVLAVFHLAGVMLVRPETWPEREEDKEWQQTVIDTLAVASSNHLNALRANIGAKRFRPLEVAGSAAAEEYPVEFAKAEELAREVKAVLDRRGTERSL